MSCLTDLVDLLIEEFLKSGLEACKKAPTF